MLSRGDSIRGQAFPRRGVGFPRVLMSLGVSKGRSAANPLLNFGPMRFQLVALLFCQEISVAHARFSW